VPMPMLTPDHIMLAYGSSTILATCREGQEFEKKKVGYCYDEIVALIDNIPQSSTPVFGLGESNGELD